MLLLVQFCSLQDHESQNCREDITCQTRDQETLVKIAAWPWKLTWVYVAAVNEHLTNTDNSVRTAINWKQLEST